MAKHNTGWPRQPGQRKTRKVKRAAVEKERTETARKLMEAMLLAAKQAGEGRRRGELVDYFVRIARTDPKSFVALLEPILEDELTRGKPERCGRA